LSILALMLGWSGAGQARAQAVGPGRLDAPTAPPLAQPGFIGAAFVANTAGWGQVMVRDPAPGVLIVLVLPGMPAEVAGLEAGDVVISIDDHPVLDDENLSVLLRQGPSPHQLRISRYGQESTVAVTPRSAPSTPIIDLLDREVAAAPSAASRLVYARAGIETPAALSIVQDIVAQYPSFAEAVAARAEVLLQDATESRNLTPPQQAVIRGAVSQAEGLDPRSMSVQLVAARVFRALGDLTGAVQVSAEAVALDDSSASAHDLLGASLLDMGRPDQAFGEIRRAVDLDPYDAQGYQDLSNDYRALGQDGLASQTDAALKALQAATPQPASSSGAGSAAQVLVAVLAAAALGGVVFLLRVPSADTDRSSADVRSSLRIIVDALAGLAVFSLLVPFLGRSLGLSLGASVTKEVAAHTVPGALVLLLCAISTARMGKAPTPDGDFFAPIAFAVGAIGLWMTATHVQVLRTALISHLFLEAVVFHAAAGPLIIGLAIQLYRTATATSEKVRTPSKHAGQLKGEITR
jgi:hypothetical protein